MVAIHKHQGKTESIPWTKYFVPNKSEAELRDIIAENPAILNENSDALPLATIMTEFILDDDRIDVFLTDAKGLPVIVETKLADNPECQGAVLEQVVRYASKLSLMNFEEINRRSGSGLEKALRSLVKTDAGYDTAKSYFEHHVRKGPVRIIIAVDSAPNSLIQEWLYENAHNRNELELIAIRKYPLSKDAVLFVPYHIVSRNSHRLLSNKGCRAVFLEIIDAFRKMEIPGIEIGMPRATNCAVYISGNPSTPGWPRQIHYEFTDWNIDENRIGIEVMAELKSFPWMKEPIVSLEKRIRERFPDKMVTVLGDSPHKKGNYKGWARLQISCYGDQPPHEIATVMKILIEETKEFLSQYVKRNS
jgi:hypothetical protein